MPVKNIRKRKNGSSSLKRGSSAEKRPKISKPLEQLLTIGQFVLRSPCPAQSSRINGIDKKKLVAIWAYSKQDEVFGLEQATLKIMTTDNELVFENQATQAFDQDYSNSMTQESNWNNNSSSSNDGNNNNSNDSGSSRTFEDTDFLIQRKLFMNLARLCMTNLITTANISLEYNNNDDMEHCVTTLTLAADTERYTVRNELFLCVFPYLYPTAYSGNWSFDGALPIGDFYRHLQPPVSKKLLRNCFGPGLRPQLTPFQSQNVEWMVQKEGFSILADKTLREIIPNRNQMPYLWEKIPVTSNGLQHIYINRVTQNVFGSWTPQLEWQQQQMYRGGILADEMGLGKTVSTIALILLNSCHNSNVYRRLNHPGLKKTGATLIITPATIIHQWESEFKRHAPTLKVAIYTGIKSIPRFMETEEMANDLSSNDVVLTSYNVLKSEIYYSRNIPKRSRRSDTELIVKRSPLVQILWWRCIVDEAQEVEGAHTLTSEMASLISSYYRWAVTGTPIKSSNFDDLYGLLRFVGNIDNFNSAQYRRLYTLSSLRQLFLDLTKTIMRRNMKSLLRDQIHIPTQHCHVVKISFSAIEQEYYNDLSASTRENSNTGWLDSIGWTKPEDASSPAFSKFVESIRSLRKWLHTLRETCVYPARTGKSKQDVQSLDQVLKIMIQTTLDKIDEAEIGLANDKLRYGGMHELIQKDWNTPLSIYLGWTPYVEEMVRKYGTKLEEAKRLTRFNLDNNSELDEETNIQGSDVKTVQLIQMALTTWQNILHRFYFYTAGVYHMLEDSDKENAYYDMAADMRRQILLRHQEKVVSSMKEVKYMDFNLSPEKRLVSFCPQKETLLLTDDFLTRVDEVADAMNKQMELIVEWRTVLKKMLTSNLVDSNEGDIQGNEYDDSLIIQKKCDIYQDIYQDILRDRHFWLNGVWQAPRVASNQEDTDTDDDTEQKELKHLRQDLEETRQSLAPKRLGSDNMRLLMAELREIASRSNATHKMENYLIQQELTRLGREIKQQKDIQDSLELEYRKLSALSNHRIEYYRALQQISDHVETWESRNPEQTIVELDLRMKGYESTIQEQTSRRRYLENMAKEKQESANGATNDEEMFCLICKEYFTKGVVTHCGHVYCEICAETWFKTSRRCPQCSAKVKSDELYPIFWSATTLQQNDKNEFYQSPSTESSSDGLSNDTLKQIEQVPIKEGLGAKLDSVIRHIKYIQQTNNGKCLVFSQWNRLLGLLANGMKSNCIGYVDLIAGKQDDSIVRFRSDPSINVMLLHSRSHSSGLTLLEAKTVIIIEPVLNESLEKQAIGRVHRIGQTEETSVFWYIVRDTIEEKIQSIHNEKQRHRQISSDIESESTSKPLLALKSDGGGEFVTDDDLRKCFTEVEEH
ncbi:SNF2 family N-terminal domain-domain-containing protein [Absidia repens]|uniref:SNF2 family N-terminal domain-domain-containing protein n=1 Tax=Absidia repens TaxID=90262 RepID=A0A1X2IRH0_9FUNG|nr:SNF2 family N-terminal domain-domain-containing protein [Absidia repens]